MAASSCAASFLTFDASWSRETEHDAIDVNCGWKSIGWVLLVSAISDSSGFLCNVLLMDDIPDT